MCNVSSHMLRSRQITLKCLYSYLIYYDWALWSDYHVFLLLTYYPARVCESYNFNYRAYNMIQARQCTLRNDLLVLIVREKGQPFLNNFGTSCISPNFLTCKHSHKEKCINELYRKATDRDFRDSYIYTPDALGGAIEN